MEFRRQKTETREAPRGFAKGDQYVYTALAGTQKAIISYRIGKRDGANTDDFVQDLRGRVLGRLRSARTAGIATSFRSATPSATAPMASSSRR